jgi:hypothetical protein
MSSRSGCCQAKLQGGRNARSDRERRTQAPRSSLVAGLATAIAAGVLALAGAAPAAAKGPVWLCLPGHRPDPCTPGLSTTVYSPKLQKLRVTHPKAVKKPAFDCFYVYPTVSDQTTAVANLHIDPVEKSIALYQAARYSQYCRVFAPMYRQTTLAGIGAPGTSPTAPTPAQAKEGPADVAAAFRTYLKKYNHGRGFVLIGHSQGSFVLRSLIAKQVDSKSAVRKRLISAILLGGNVLVRNGSDKGGDFKHIPACHSRTQVGCVIAFSTFNAQPPAVAYSAGPPRRACTSCAPTRPRWAAAPASSTRSSRATPSRQERSPSGTSC